MIAGLVIGVCLGAFVAVLVLAVDGRAQWLPPQGTGDETGRYDR